MRYPDRLQLPLAFDPVRLARDLAAIAQDDWIAHFVKRNYEGDWSVIPLRGPRGATHPVQMIYSDPGCRDFVDTPVLAACPHFQEVFASFRCPLHAVRLMRLGPGATIKEHTDNDLSFEDGMVRVHIPIVTNPDVEFLLNGTRVVLDVGTAWYLRLSDPHSVANRGAEARVHMVIDAVVDAWVAGLLDIALRTRSEADRCGHRVGTESAAPQAGVEHRTDA